MVFIGTIYRVKSNNPKTEDLWNTVTNSGVRGRLFVLNKLGSVGRT